ncbi:MAG: hypothetical protein AB7U05_02610 [Mangrovibacterium sp.]
MKLTVDSKLIYMPADASISIEMTSPVLNDKTGSFSYPFPVPTAPNQKVLGWPGRLQRKGEITEKEFVLEDQGIQLLRGVIDFDSITREETGLILKSGALAFEDKLKGVTLSDLPFDRYQFPGVGNNMLDLNFANNLESGNNADNGMFVCYPFKVQGLTINRVSGTNAYLMFYEDEYQSAPTRFTYSLQFKLSYILSKIFEYAGFTVTENQLTGTFAERVVVVGKLFNVVVSNEMFESGLILEAPDIDYLEFSDLMPDMEALAFLEKVINLGVRIDMDNLRKTAVIYFQKGVLQAEPVRTFDKRELAGWEHYEEIESSGMELTYASQPDSLDTETGYEIHETVSSYANLPAVNEDYQEKIVHVTSTDRDYKLVETETDVWQWKRIGRLKPYLTGDGSDEYEIDVIVPPSIAHTHAGVTVELPDLDTARDRSFEFMPVPFTMLLAWPKRDIGGVSWPLLTSDEKSVDGSITFDYNLTPKFLFDNCYGELITWQTFIKKKIIKYLKLSLSEAVRLNWRRMYIINGVPIVLDKVNMDVPYKGIVKIEGYKAALDIIPVPDDWEPYEPPFVIS